MIRAALLMLLLAAPLAAQTAPRHVVVVLLDDVGIDKIGAYGHPTAGPTPRIDAMAAAGVRFTRAYSNPTCSPTRAAALTGRYGSRTGVDTGYPTYDPTGNPNGDFDIALTEPFLPRLLLGLGVRSYLVGKWHLCHVLTPDYHAHPIACGFTRWRGHLSNIIAGQGEGYYSWRKQAADGAGWAETTTTSFHAVDNALEAYLALQASAGSRSLVWLAFNAAHPPWDELPPANLWTPVGGSQTQPKKQQYALQAVDTLLGQLLDFYAATMPADAAQTLWLVMGDNGTPAAAIEAPTQPHQHKETVYEGGVHVPLIAFGAGVDAPGRTSDALVHAVDIHATALALFGGSRLRPAGSDSISFAQVIQDHTAAGARAAVYFRHAQPNGHGPKDWLEHGATDGRWALLERVGATPAHELFDLAADPQETDNLWPASTPEEVAAVAALQAVIDASAAP